jgi:hypothetical protein
MKKILATIALLVLSVPAMAQQVTFAWDPHDQADQITGFKLYSAKQSGGYGATAAGTFNPGTATTGTIPQPALGRWYFVLRAYVDNGADGIVESENSNEVSLTLKPKPPKLLSAIQTAAMLPVRGVKWLLAMNQKKNLRVLK